MKEFEKNLKSTVILSAYIDEEKFCFFDTDESGICAEIIAVVHMAEKEEILDLKNIELHKQAGEAEPKGNYFLLG